MATYAELLSASEDPTLNNKIRVAVVIAANVVAGEATNVTNHANRLLWAKGVYSDPVNTAKKMLWAVLAQNSTATLAQILSADDGTVQTAVNNAIDVFAQTGTL